MLSVKTSPIILSVIMLSVVAPFEGLFTHKRQINTISIKTFLSLQIATSGDSDKKVMLNRLCKHHFRRSVRWALALLKQFCYHSPTYTLLMTVGVWIFQSQLLNADCEGKNKRKIEKKERIRERKKERKKESK